MPTILIGYESPDLRPARDDNYNMVMDAFWRLFQSSSTPNFSIQDIVAYHEAFELQCRLGWFVDAIQLCERIKWILKNNDG